MHRNKQTAMFAAAMLLAQARIQAQSFVDYSAWGNNYTQNFNSLPYSNNVAVSAANPVTINTQVYTFNNTGMEFAAPIDGSGSTNASTGGLGLALTMPGWYGTGAATTRYSAQDGSQTQGGITSFGGLTSNNRALGLMSANGSGITTFGVKIVNDTGGDLTNFSLSFIGELWREQTTAKNINFGYLVTNITAGLPVTGATSLGTISFATGTSGAVDGTLSANQTNITLAGQSVTWHNGDVLWLTWQTASASGNAQGIAIDNLTFSAVPEPSALLLAGSGLLGILVLRRRK